MSTPVNLNKVRKQRARAAKKARAKENVIRFGQTKAQKQAEKRDQIAAARYLDGHKKDQ